MVDLSMVLTCFNRYQGVNPQHLPIPAALTQNQGHLAVTADLALLSHLAGGRAEFLHGSAEGPCGGGGVVAELRKDWWRVLE